MGESPRAENIGDRRAGVGWTPPAWFKKKAVLDGPQENPMNDAMALCAELEPAEKLRLPKTGVA